MNQNNNICPQCGNDTKIVPAGLSKRTGKAYASFVSCTSRDCKFTSPVPNPLPVIPDGMPMGIEPPKTPHNGEAMIMEELGGINQRLDKLVQYLIVKLGKPE